MNDEQWKYQPPSIFAGVFDPIKYLALPDADKRSLWALPPIEQAMDNVNSPSHYTTGGIECFDAMRAMLSGEEMVGYLRGNSFKYRWRFRKKGGVEDLEKAEWYERKLKEIIALLP